MKAKDIMTTGVVAVRTDTKVPEIAKLLLDRRISAVPVLDHDGRLVGLVSEGDLMHRAEAAGPRRRPWWISMLTTPEEAAFDYVKTKGTKAEDVMTRNVFTVDEDTEVARIAQLLEEKHIKRVPVVKNDMVVGIVSRADLLRGVAMAKPDDTGPGDQAIREAVLERLHREAGIRDSFVSVTVSNGIVHLWGAVRTEIERRAAKVAAETVNGVTSVDDHLSVLPRSLTD